MEGNLQKKLMGEELSAWWVPEYVKHERGKRWYIIAVIGAFLMLVFAFFTSNFLFAVIVVIASLVLFLNDKEDPATVHIVVLSTGILVGRKFYDYDEFKNFSVIYKPQDDVKNLYLEFSNALKQRLSIPLEKENPLQIRENLLRFLPENLERVNQPLSEGLARLFKI